MARQFNGSSQFLHTTSDVTGGEFTFAGWLYWSSVSGTQMCACQWVETGGQKHWYLLTIGSALYFGHSEGGFVGTNLIHSTSLSATTWYHICARFKNGTSKSIAINGASESAAAPGTIYSSGSPGFTMGYDPPSTYYWGGAIANAAAWNVSITDAELSALASGYTPDQVRPSALIASWPFGGLWGDTDDDRWSGAYDLTPTGSPTFGDQPRMIYPDEPFVVTGAAAVSAATYSNLLLLGVG